MALARWQATIQDERGDIFPGAYVEVRREIPGAPLATLYADREGTTPLGNPFTADAEGFAAFHVEGGSFKIRAYSGTFQRTFRYVGVGTSSETDFGTAFLPRGAWEVSTDYDTADVVSHTQDGVPYAFASNHDGNSGNAPQFDSSDTGISDEHWTVLRLIEAPGSPGADGDPGSSNVVGTSLSSVAIGTGAKSFTIVESDRGWGVGARLRVSSDANPTANYMEGIVTSYSGNTLNLSVDIATGAGSHTDWTINLAGQQGQDGSANTNLTIYDESTGTNTIVAGEEATWTRHIFKAGETNTGAATYNGDPLLNSAGGALRAGEIQAGVWYDLIHDGTNYYLVMSGAVR